MYIHSLGLHPIKSEILGNNLIPDAPTNRVACRINYARLHEVIAHYMFGRHNVVLPICRRGVCRVAPVHQQTYTRLPKPRCRTFLRQISYAPPVEEILLQYQTTSVSILHSPSFSIMMAMMTSMTLSLKKTKNPPHRSLKKRKNSPQMN